MSFIKLSNLYCYSVNKRVLALLPDSEALNFCKTFIMLFLIIFPNKNIYTNNKAKYVEAPF